MGLTYREVVDEFLKGSSSSISNTSKNLKIADNRLIHFNTVIAERQKNKILLNVSRYSILTGKLQKLLSNLIPFSKRIEIHNVPGNYSGTLTKFLKN